MSQLTSIILAAGWGAGANSQVSNVLLPVLGRPVLHYVVDMAHRVGASPIMVFIDFEGEAEMKTLGTSPDFQYFRQDEPGAGLPLWSAWEFLAGVSGEVLMLEGNTPLLRAETIRELISLKRSNRATAAVLTVKTNNFSGYNKVIRDEEGNIAEIIEDKNTQPDPREIHEVDSGIYCFETEALRDALSRIVPRNNRGEIDRTDLLRAFLIRGHRIIGLKADEKEVLGPENRVQLAQIENILKNSINNKWMTQGVTIEDPSFTYIGPEVEIGSDSLILPGTMIFGRTKIGRNCIIGPHTRIVNSKIGENTEIAFSQIVEADLGPDNKVGPFAYLRPGTISDQKVKIGDFVEIKNTRIGQGSKVPHLTYLGDAEIGTSVNIGAGTIICNYDGVHKNRTVIKDGAFIGSNANLVAPVEIGEGATVAAGSTITEKVPDKALGIGRSRQENKLTWRSPRERAGK